MAKPKILCLHGFAESGDIFRIRSRNIRALLEPHAELVYLDGPVDVGSLRFTSEEIADPQPSEFVNLAWWWKRGGKNIELRGLGQSLQLIQDQIKEQGPFQGILGFSQGASLATIVAALLQGTRVPGLPEDLGQGPLDFVILSGAFCVETPEHQLLYQTPIRTPSLHIMGEYDTVVGIDLSRKLASAFVDPKLFEFRGGHFIPLTAQCVKAVEEFVSPFVPGLNTGEAEACEEGNVEEE
ncbi:Ovarian cancer-associated protein 2 [Coemansia sp. Benny D115]|nr:Ovarian cancer-associated protein 2 [Coemansia sp. Benny D115]